MDPRIRAIIANLKMLDEKFERLEDRVGVLEENTCTNESRLEDLERWQEKADDKLDEY